MNRAAVVAGMLALLTALAGSTAVAIPAAPPGSAAWNGLADDAVARFRSYDTGAAGVMAYSLMAASVARRSPDGWRDQQALAYLAKVRAARNPDGGYGLNRAVDTYPAGDGKVNPADTTYTITVTDHVGPVLLAAYRSGTGAATAAEIRTLVQLVMGMPRIDTAAGRCIPYSRYDTGAALCVHNVNASAGRFLADTAAAGITVSGQARMVVEITRREVAAYDPGAAWWHRRDTPAWDDVDHASFEAESMHELAHWIGRESAYDHLWPRVYPAGTSNAMDGVALLRLAGLPRLAGDPDWCAGAGARWPEIQTWASSWGPANLAQLAQVAYYGTRAAAACG